MPSLRPCSYIFRPVRLFFALVPALFLLLLACSGLFAANQASRPRFNATFLQLWDVHNSYTERQWDELCQRLTAMGVEEIILQWSLITERPFLWRLDGERRDQVPHDPIEPAPAVRAVVRAAERSGLKVRFGLSQDPNWWGEIKSEARLTGVYLNRLFQDQINLARSLSERFGTSPCFAGFYIPQEIDDKTWLEPDKETLLANHLKRLSAYLKRLKPAASVAISCFFNGKDDPAHVTRFWQRMFSFAELDYLYVQDGIGAGKLELEESALYMRALAQAAGGSQVKARAIVEIFQKNPLPAPSLDAPAASPQKGHRDEPFHAGFQPAPMSRVARQLAQAQEILGTAIIAFSLPEYATPMGGRKAHRLGQDYQNYLVDK